MLGERHRIRVRFAKRSALRLLGHRDLIRVFERALRRTGVRLSLSQGFHPKARLSFPLALATGMEGAEEVMEVELEDALAPAEFSDLMGRELPDGLTILSAIKAPERPRKARVLRVRYRLPLPPGWEIRVRERIAAFSAHVQEPWWVRRAGRDEPLDARIGLESIELVEGHLQVIQAALSTAIVGPRELLRALELNALEDEGVWWTRDRVELEPAATESLLPRKTTQEST